MEISALKELQKLQKEFTRCSICFDVYHQPKMLPCLHTFCFQCLENFRVESSPLPIACPLCRGEAPQTTEGIQALPTNFLIVRLIDTKLVTGEGDSGGGRFVPCDSCCQEAEDPDDAVAAAAPSPAAMFCVECSEKLCESCVSMHRKMKLSKGHQLVTLESDNTGQLSQLLKNKPVNCEVHADERIVFFCLTCESTICMKCCMLAHKTHDYKDISEVSAMFKTGLSSIIESISGNIAKFQASSVRLEKQRQRLESQAKHVEEAVEDKVRQLIAEIEQHKSAVLEATKEYKEEKTDEIDDLSEDIQVRLDTLESFREFCQELKDKGTNYEITKLAKQFVGRHKALVEMSSAAELTGVDVDLKFKSGPVDSTLSQSVSFMFGQLSAKSPEATGDAPGPTQPKKKYEKKIRNRPPRSNVPPTASGPAGQQPKGPKNKQAKPGSAKNQPNMDKPCGGSPCGGFARTFSSGSADSMKENPPPKTSSGEPGESKTAKGTNPLFSATYEAVIPGNKPVQGIAALGLKLLVARAGTPFIEIFDMSNNEIAINERRKQQHIPGLGNAFDMAVDVVNEAVYVSETMKMCVFRLGFKKNGSCQVSQFTTVGKPFGLSVNFTRNVLVACPVEKQVQEYGHTGTLVRVISTSAHCPRHVIELSYNQFAMLAEDHDHLIVLSKFVVDAGGKMEIQKQYGGQKTPPQYRLNEPTHLALESRFNVILLADCNNNRVAALRSDNLYFCGNVPWKMQIQKATRICLDQFGAMYVGTCDGLITKYSLKEGGVGEGGCVAKEKLLSL